MMVKDKDGEWKEVTGQVNIEQACIDENKAKLSQSTHVGTPFMQQPLLAEFGDLAIGDNTQRVLQ